MAVRKRRAIRGRIVAAGFAAAVLLAACTPARTAGTPSRVIALRSMSALRAMFNHDQGHARLVLIFSPT